MIKGMDKFVGINFKEAVSSAPECFKTNALPDELVPIFDDNKSEHTFGI